MKKKMYLWAWFLILFKLSLKESITPFICFFPHRDLDNTALTALIYGTSIHFYENMKKVLKITTVMNYESKIFLGYLKLYLWWPKVKTVGTSFTRLCILIQPIFLQKVSLNFWIWLNPPPFYQKVHKFWFTKSVPNFLVCFGFPYPL